MKSMMEQDIRIRKLYGKRSKEGLESSLIHSLQRSCFGSLMRIQTINYMSFKKDTDIIVFTEVIDNDSIKDLLDKLDSEYIKYASKIREVKQYNQIVIAVKTELIPCSKIRQVDIDEKKWDINSLPDICHLEIITSEGKLKNVIGTRVRIDGGSDADYKDRRVQFENLVRYIEELENVIVLGDFNNGMLKADSDKDYDSVKDKYEKRWDKKKRRTLKIL